MINLKIYHGSTVIVKKPSTDIEQAKRWTKIKKGRMQEENKDDKIKRYINIYEYTENKNLNILNFEEATEQWLDFVYRNRKSRELLHDYDIVKGPVADDNLFATLRLYERNYTSKEDTIRALKTYKLVNLISFHTSKAIDTIKYIETKEVEENE